MLHEADRHEPLTSAEWDRERARVCIDSIVRDAIERYSARQLWPAHPLEISADVRRDLYIGAAGTIWALSHLADAAPAVETAQLSEVVPSLLEPNRARIREVEARGVTLGTNGLLIGDTGILLLQAR